MINNKPELPKNTAVSRDASGSGSLTNLESYDSFELSSRLDKLLVNLLNLLFKLTLRHQRART